MATPSREGTPDEITTSQASLRGWYGGALFLVAMVLAAPIWMVENPPLVDYPNHLARGYILYHHDDVPIFAKHFEVGSWTPNLAMDAFMVALQPFGDLRTIGKLFLTLTVWLWLAGWHLLGCAIHGRPTWLALGGGLVAYHSMFLYGFTNFSFGLGMFLVSAAAWLSWRENWTWWRFLLMTMLAFGCFFSHMAAFIFLAGTALAVTLWDIVQRKKVEGKLLVDLGPVLMPLLLVLRGGARSGVFAWSTFTLKLVGALCLFRGYNRHLDACLIAGTALLVVLLGVWATNVRVSGGTLFAGLGCVFMFLVGPYVIFGGSPADARFLPPAAALIVLSFDLAYPRRKALGLLILFLALVAFRFGFMLSYWQSFDADIRDQVQLLQSLPDQAKVYPIVNVPGEPEEEHKRGLASFHVFHYAVLDRHIYSPHVLAFTGQQPIRYNTPPIAFHMAQGPAPALADADWDLVFANYDYLWCWRLPESQRLWLRTRCTLVAESGDATIWRIAKSLK